MIFNSIATLAFFKIKPLKIKKIILIIAKLFCLTSVLSLIVACSSVSHKDALLLRPYLDKRVQVSLPNASVVPPLELQELLEIKYQDQNHSLMVLFKSDGQCVSLTGLSHLGIKLFSAIYDQTGLKKEQFIKIKQLPAPEQVLLDVMLGHTNVDYWQDLLPQGYVFYEKDNKRTLFNDQGKLIYEIDMGTKDDIQVPIKLKNHNFGYEIIISYL